MSFLIQIELFPFIAATFVIFCLLLQIVWTQIRADKISVLIWTQQFDTLMMVFLKAFLKKLILIFQK